MIHRFRDIARSLVAVLLLGMAGAAAQTAPSPTSPNPGAASQAGSVPTAQAPAQPASPAGPQINIAEIIARANREVGVNIETAINGWQHELEQIPVEFTYGHLEKFFSPSRCESDSLIAMGHGRMERASHGADGLFRY